MKLLGMTKTIFVPCWLFSQSSLDFVRNNKVALSEDNGS